MARGGRGERGFVAPSRRQTYCTSANASIPRRESSRPRRPIQPRFLFLILADIAILFSPPTLAKIFEVLGEAKMTAVTAAPRREPAFDERPARWRIGLIALATDHTSERDFARMRPSDEVAVYVNRVAYANPTTIEYLRRMQPLITEAASLILPDEPLDVIAYGCTSASVVIGDDEVRAAVQRAKPGVPCVTPTGAAMAAFEALSVKRISILTPYSAEVSEALRRYFLDRGLEVANLTCFGLDDDRVMARLTPETIIEAALEGTHPSADALFISCTALRAAQVAGRVEDQLGKPVVTSNQAMVWQALRLAGCAASLGGYGRLLRI